MQIQKLHVNESNHLFSVIENQRFNYKPATLLPYGSGWQYNKDITAEEETYPNGYVNIVYYATAYIVGKKVTEDELINGFIRCFYTINDELAVLRRRDERPEEFEEYNNKIQECIEISREIYKKF